ncbi:MAG: energy-coupling factor transporter transmembrane component T, partial [bacterium]
TSSRIAARLDPRVRIVIFLALAITMMVTLRFGVYLLLSALLLPGLFLLSEVRTRLKSLVFPLLIMVAITSALHLLFPPGGGKELLRYGPFWVSDAGLMRAAMFSWRIGLFVLLAVLLTVAISPDEISQACWRGLAKLRIPVAGVGAALYLAIRFLPELAQHYEQVRTAQQIRGAQFSGGLLRRTKLSLPLVVPVVTAALRKANTLADCLLVRGWGAAPNRTFFGVWHLRVADWLLLPALLLLLVAIAILTR